MRKKTVKKKTLIPLLLFTLLLSVVLSCKDDETDEGWHLDSKGCYLVEIQGGDQEWTSVLLIEKPDDGAFDTYCYVYVPTKSLPKGIKSLDRISLQIVKYKTLYYEYMVGQEFYTYCEIKLCE